MTTFQSTTQCTISLFMAVSMLLLGFLMTILTVADGQGIGVCYGTLGNDLPTPEVVVAMYRDNGIGKMRIYAPNTEIMEALRQSDIELMLGVPNEMLPDLASKDGAADGWVQENVIQWSDVKITYISVGNEISPFRESNVSAQYLVPAMRNIYNAIAANGLQEQVKVSTAIDTGLMANSFPPSSGAFKNEVLGMINPLVEFLVNTRSPLLVNLYTYFSFIDNKNIGLNYAAFKDPLPQVTDTGNNLQYQNLFDAMVDAVYAALERAGGPGLDIVISETGWPSDGGDSASLDNAGSYNQNLIKHVSGGTPKKLGIPLETYVFAMFNENQKPGQETEKHFGLFYPNQEPVYPIVFS